MSSVYSEFDTHYRIFFRQLYALCLITTRHPADARELFFQSMLRLGASKQPPADADAAARILFSAAVRLGGDYYSRKLRKKPSLSALRAHCPHHSVSDGLYALMGRPLAVRTARTLAAFGLDASAIASCMRIRVSRVPSLLRASVPEDDRLLIDEILLDDEEEDQLNARTYQRFAVRSVGVENLLHDLRSGFDRTAPWLALAVLFLFAATALYTAHLPQPPLP